MVDNGMRELPKPPRRVPGWAAGPDPGTSIQPRPARTEPAVRPRPQGPRFRFLIPLLVVVLVLGVGAGRLVREQGRTLDSEQVLGAAGPSVVRVLATTCDGTGQATGVRIGDGLVLTAASAVRGPVSVALETTGGQVRRATVVGTSSLDGVAVLRVVGQLDAPAAALAPGEPDAKAERAVLGYTTEGHQTVQPAGTAESAKPLSQVVGETSLGAPVLDNRGRVVGVVTGETVAGSKVVGLSELRKYIGAQPPIIPEALGTCSQARGPQASQTPTLATANTPTAGEVVETLAAYLNALNRHDFAAMGRTYTPRLAARHPVETDAAQHRTSYAFGATVSQVTPSGAIGAQARMSFTVLHSPDSPSAKGTTCSRLTLQYLLVRVSGRMRIESSAAVPPGNLSCDVA
jgi:hypothetical protein